MCHEEGEGKAVTESDWACCTDLRTMLNFLRGKASDRKLRLFACAACRSVWQSLTAHRVRQAIEVAELYADARATDDDLIRARSLACQSAHGARRRRSGSEWVRLQIEDNRSLFAAQAAYLHKPFLIGRLRWVGVDPEIKGIAPPLLRDIFGPLPFRRVCVPATILDWNSGTVHQLAQTIYEERALPEGALDTLRLTILADALEEAGCDYADVLNHLRGPGPHVRGCWVVDLLLAKS